MNDERESPPLVKSSTDARQGAATGTLRWVLAISLAAAIIAMLLAYFAA